MSRFLRRSHSTKSHNAVKEVIPSSPHDGHENGWSEEVENGDPTEPDIVRFDVFYNHWGQIGNTIFKNQNTSGFSRFHSHKPSPDEVQSVMNYLRQMVMLLVEEESPDDGQVGRILAFTNEQNILERMLVWGEETVDHAQDIQHELLRSFESLIGQAKQRVLFQDKVLNALLRLLLSCWEDCSEFLEPQLLLLLHQLCVSLTRDQPLLEYFFHASPSKGPAKFLLFSLLIPFIHRDGSLGQQARDALLLCISASRDAEHIAKYIADSTSLCPVLAGGLGALYSRLPRKLNIQADNWHSLTYEDISRIPELCMFLNSLEFCNAVVQVSHPIVSMQLLQYFHDGFLVPVVGPALHQFSAGSWLRLRFGEPPPNDEITTATAYVQLFIRSITDPQLIRVFLEYLCRGWHDNNKIIDSLLKRIAADSSKLFIRSITDPQLIRVFLEYLCRGWHDNNKIIDSLLKRIAADSSKLCLVTLSLFHTLINLNCEDVMMELVFQHLIPCNHIMASQRRAIQDITQISGSSQKFLSLIPDCCTRRTSSKMYSKNPLLPPTDGKTPSSPYVVHLGEKGRVVYQSSQEDLLAPSRDTRTRTISSSGSSTSTAEEDHSTSSLLEYLDDSRAGIEECSQGCQRWVAPYDGIHPSPANFVPPSPSYTNGAAPSFFALQRLSSTPTAASQRGADKLDTTHEDESAKKPKRGSATDWQAMISNNNGMLNATIEEILTLDLGEVNSMDVSDVNLADIFNGEKLNILSQEEKANKQVKVGGYARPGGNQGNLSLAHHKRISRSSDSAFSSQCSPTTDTISSNGNYSSRLNPSLHPGSQGGSQEDFRGGTSPMRYPAEGSQRSTISSQSSLKEGDEPSVFYMYDSDYDATPGAVHLCPPGGDSFFEEADEILMSLGYKTGEVSPYGTRDLRHLESLTESDQEGDVSLSFSQQLNSPGGDTVHSSSSSDGRGSPANMEFGFGGSNQSSITATPVPLRTPRQRSQEETPPQMTPRGLFNRGDMNGNVYSSGPPYSPIGKVSGQPDTGPFLNILFKKLEGMMQNSLYMNLLLTGIVTRLAYFPQPLLRSFLLNTNMVFQPSVKSLIQVLTLVKKNLDKYAADMGPDWDRKLSMARQYLWVRETGLTPARDRSATVMDGKQSTQRLRSSSVMSPTGSKKSFSDFFRRGKRKPAIKVTEGQKLSTVGESTPNRPSDQDSVRTKNAVYCAVVFEEFMKELAATCQEHVVGVIDKV